MAKEEVENSLNSSGSINDSLQHGRAEPRTTCRPLSPNKAPPAPPRLPATSPAAVVAVTLLAYASIFLLSRLEAQRRQRELGYCERSSMELITSQAPTTEGQGEQSETSALATRHYLSLALPAASVMQRQRMAQQAEETIDLFHYHCRSMQLYSADFQSLVMVANGAGTLMIGIVVWLSRQARKDELRWPFPLILTSACSFALALATIRTFNLQDNMLRSRSLAEQTSGFARGFTTSIANQAFREGNTAQALNESTGLAGFLEQMDTRLSLVDRSEFVINDQVDEKEARFLYQRILPDHK